MQRFIAKMIEISGRAGRISLKIEKLRFLIIKQLTKIFSTVQLTNKKPGGFMQSCFPVSVYFKCLSEFLLYFYKCSTSMAFT